MKLTILFLFLIAAFVPHSSKSSAQSFGNSTLTFANNPAARTIKGTVTSGIVIIGGKATMKDGKGGFFVWCNTCTGKTDDDSSFIRNVAWGAGEGWDRVGVQVDETKYVTFINGDARYMRYADTVPTGEIMTKTMAQSAISGLESEISNKVNVSDTANMLSHYYRLNNPNGYISSYTETDPTVSANIKAITPTNISNWNTAYGWGNHASAGYLLSSTAAATYQPTGSYATTSQLATKLNITDTTGKWKYASYSPSSAEIISGLGYSPYNGVTNSNGYITTGGARAAISLTTTGSGAAAYNSTTGVLNIPTPPAATTYTAGSGISITSGTIANTSPETYTLKTWSRTGFLTNNGILVTDTFSVSTATPTITFALPTGTTQAKLISATGYRAGATVSNAPQVAITGTTSTTASFIISEQNTATVTILGLQVLSGLPMILVANPTNVKLLISYVAY